MDNNVLFVPVLVTIDLALMYLVLSVIVDRAGKVREENARCVLKERVRDSENA